MNDRHARGRRTATLVLAWLLAVGVGAGLAWFAVDRAGRAVLEPSVATQRLPVPTESTAPTASPTPVTPTPTPSAPAPSGSSTGPTLTASLPAGPVAGAQPSAGGTVAVSCDGDAARLSYATPRPGWSAEVHHAGPGEVRVEFERGHDGDDVEIRATCTGGRPVFEVEQD